MWDEFARSLLGKGDIPHSLLTPRCGSPGDGWIHKAVVVGSGIHIVEEVQVFRDPQPVESLVISHAQVRGGRSVGGSTHGAHLCCKALIGLFGGQGVRDSWVTPARDTHRSLVGQPGGQGPAWLSPPCQVPAAAVGTDCSWGPFPMHAHQGRAVLWGWGEISGHHGAEPPHTRAVLNQPFFTPEEPVCRGSQRDPAAAPGLLCQIHLLL